MSEENKAAVRQGIERLDKHDFGIFQELLPPDDVIHLSGTLGPLDRQGHEELARLFYEAFPDLTHIVEDQIAEGDRVATRFTVRGIQ